MVLKQLTKEQAKDEINKIIEEFKKKLTLNGKSRVFENKQKLASEFIIDESDPEDLTRDFLIDKILFDILKINLIAKNRHFRAFKELRKVDYELKINDKKILLEAKPINADLFDKSSDSAVNQIIGIFRLAEVKENYEFGVASDGLQWVFIDKNSNVVHTLNIFTDFEKIKEILIGKEPVSIERVEEDITKKFYDWYNALLHGGQYKDHENKNRKISEIDCLVENILYVSKSEDRQRIAQTIMDRLIFIRFLQTKYIVKSDILEYLSKLDENILNDKLRQLFFEVMNTKSENRVNIDTKFEKIPYLNGSLFVRTEVEIVNQDYKVKAEILKEIIKFLDSFNFVHKEFVGEEEFLDPEILGYIFERAMNATDRKGTGAYYTPKTITKYISENTIYPVILSKVNELLRKKEYKESELLTDFEQIYDLRESTLSEIHFDIIQKIKVCDNACGSGAFLLSAAETLLSIYKRIDNEIRLHNPEAGLRRLILENNLYGVDINPNAIEIAKLRLWLWLVAAYPVDKIQPLPNIDSNIINGNSLIGYVTLEKFRNEKISLNNWLSDSNSINSALQKREFEINEYKNAVGDKAKKLKIEIQEDYKKMREILDSNLYKEINTKIKFGEKEFKEQKLFHWEFEFPDVFDGNREKAYKGFDVVIGNPPYVRSEVDDAEYQKQRRFMENSGEYIALYEKWDLFVAFIERGLRLLKDNGCLSLIISNSFNTSKYADKIKKFILDNYWLKQIDFFKDIYVFRGVGVESVILLIQKNKFKGKTKRLLHVDNFDNVKELQLSDDVTEMFRISSSIKFDDKFANSVKLGDICFISKGMVIHSEESNYKGEFTKDDLISDIPTKTHIKKYIEAKYLQRYFIKKIKYLEWNTNRSPAKLSRPTFPELYIYPKIIRGRTTDGMYDEDGILCNESACVFVLYDNLKKVSNRSIEISINKRNDKNRKELEDISKDFNIKYVLGILNSKFAKFYLNTIRRHRIEYYFYSDDFKKLPIKKISSIKQQTIINLVDKIISLNKRFNEIKKTQIEEKAQLEKEIQKLDNEIDEEVYNLYGITEEEKKIIEESLK